MAIYHVKQQGGCNKACGCADHPFATINHAAQVALPGDEIIVHAGVYRETVKPRWGGKANTLRITYKALPGEKVVIKGSEVIKNWEKVELEGASVPVYRAVLPNAFFGDYNPYSTILSGDWLMDPFPHCLHTGDVYIDGLSLYECTSLEGVKNPVKRTTGPCSDWVDTSEIIPDPERTLLVWYAEVDDDNTTIYAHFGALTPEQLATHEIEINVRETCFAPQNVNTNYLTIEGFEMAQAATQWAPPTGVQRGMIDTYWSKGWIIRNCHLHDAKTSAISIGKEISTGDNESTRFKHKPGYQTQLEAVFKAIKRGWSKELVGSHEICHNTIHDCGQNAVVGHLGCINSKIHHNHIFNIAMKHEYFGHEIAGIKLHAAIDVELHHNEIHDCTLGTWLDWEAQGTHVCSNVYYNNYRDIMIEVTHGPCLVANNIFASDYNFDNVAQGTALINNLFAGTTRTITVLERATPYHLPHSTDVAGYAVMRGGDDRVYGNVFLGGVTCKNPINKCGTAFYDGHCASYEEYHEKALATGAHDNDRFDLIPEPVYINHNVYLRDAPAFAKEEHNVKTSHDPELKVYRNEQGLHVDFNLCAEQASLTLPAQGTATLGYTRFVEGFFENADGSPFVINYDLKGESRDESACHAGPLEHLQVGKNTVKIWD